MNNVSFEIRSGEIVGLLGESGCGKTTLACSLLGLFPPAGKFIEGSIRFEGLDILSLNENRLQQIRGDRISIVFQEPGMSLNPVMSAGDQVAEVIRAHRSWSYRRCRQEAEAVLSQLGFAELRRVCAARPHQLSGGQRQRVLLGQALACGPSLMIADEPTTALDTTVQAEILALFRSLKSRRRCAILFITHDPSVLVGLADRVLVMYAGKIVEDGPLNQVFSEPLHPYSVGLLKSLPQQLGRGSRARLLPAIAGFPPDPARLPVGCSFAPRCPNRQIVCTLDEPEEIRTRDARRIRCFRYAG